MPAARPRTLPTRFCRLRLSCHPPAQATLPTEAPGTASWRCSSARTNWKRIWIRRTWTRSRTSRRRRSTSTPSRTIWPERSKRCRRLKRSSQRWARNTFAICRTLATS
uniref:(northern house mosquito) hypothetical protein n=1 Tax=Culex pipiens TaxID=7175 RepID=A0A8D8HG69_CULPI